MVKKLLVTWGILFSLIMIVILFSLTNGNFDQTFFNKWLFLGLTLLAVFITSFWYVKKNRGMGIFLIIMSALLLTFSAIGTHNKVQELTVAREGTNIEASRVFAKKYPQCKYITEITDIVDYYDLMALAIPTPDDYDKYISKYPQSKHREDVLAKWQNLLIQQHICGSATLDRLKTFIDRFPSSNKQIKSYYDQTCFSLYQEAVRTHTIDGWEAYRRKVPESEYRDSERRISEIKEEMLWGTEGRAWATARERNNMEAYEKYVKLYPAGAHVKQAKDKLIELEVKEVFAGSYGSLPSMERTGGITHGTTTEIELYNNTEYTLTVLYSGPAKRKVVLRPKKKQTIFLPNGNYDVAAKVDASGISPCAGREEMNGTAGTVTYYIKSSSIPSYRFR